MTAGSTTTTCPGVCCRNATPSWRTAPPEPITSLHMAARSGSKWSTAP
eukprot:CAMPEP_0198220472 /NCGR_PEP_ID=MMETSP1445-20131203/79245_1 /TAXON_ID=36898 /ORGANISM="Pyramimonas sp., Strain CCMP2087" /LENGTH=47 /DNA_ID= /DNA_START= /DNA_END= /DNA_ORIENTATION=